MKTETAMELGQAYKGYLSFYTLDEYLKKMKRLFTKHQRISIWSCNGTKYQDSRAIQYATDYEYTEDMFMVDIAKVEKLIAKLLLDLGKGFTVEYQGDPRGYTCKLYYRASKRDGEHKDYKGVFVDLEQGE